MAWLRPRTAAVAVVVTLVGSVLASCGSPPSEGSTSLARASARQFLHDYVNADGAVIRRDQGGDVVSEGQGYALLLAFALDDPHRFAKIWTWTRTHLQRPDGLFAYHWQNGSVVDSTPAADADTQIAWALALAGQAWSLSADTTQARRIAAAIAENEIGYDDEGHPTLAAGPWAIVKGRSVTVEPGYWTFPADAALATLTGDHRWQALTAADAAHLAAVTDDGSQLPADWASLGGAGGPHPTAAPQTDAAASSGQDGLRAMVWATCLAATHPLAARWWHAIAATARDGPLTRDLSGSPAAPGPSSLSFVAAAAVANAAGNDAQTTSLLRLADRNAAEHSTYYGDAWNALGQILLTTDLIPGCTT